MPSRTLWNSGRSNRKITSTPTALAISSTIGAEIGAARSFAASGPKTSFAIGCCTTHVSTNFRKAVLNGKANPVAMHPPQRNATANNHGVCRSRRSRSHSKLTGTIASMPESASEHADNVRAHAREQAEMNEDRKTQDRDQRRADCNADFAPAQRRARELAVVIEVRYQGRLPGSGRDSD